MGGDGSRWPVVFWSVVSSQWLVGPWPLAFGPFGLMAFEYGLSGLLSLV
jgi:hypothetical protein